MDVQTDSNFDNHGRPPSPGPDVFRVLSPEGRVDPKTDPKIDLELVLRMYQGMVRTRFVDQRLTKLQRQGRIGFHVGAEGEEAAIVGAAAALRPQDWVFPCYREVGAALYRGLPLQTYIDNMYGNANDVPQGRQMPDHVSGRDARYVSVTAPIGTQITQAVGFAWAAKLKGEDVVTAPYFGDGATSANDFHAAMTFAGVFKTPTVFLLRNNGWAISVAASQQSACERFSDKALGYGLPAVRCDGNDALAVYHLVSEAVKRAARDHTPTLVELLTYRVGPHTTSDDPSVYRKASEVDQALACDPLRRVYAYLEGQGAWSAAQQADYERSVGEELQRCIEQAEATAPPAVATMFEDVYEHMPEHLRMQQAECATGPRARKRHGR